MPSSLGSSPAPILFELTRGPIVEVVHRGHISVSEPDGKLIYAKGDPEVVTFLRSSTKPFQAAFVIYCGAAEAFGLTQREIALIAGSHGGESIHTATVRQILAKGSIPVEALQCGVHPPLDQSARSELEREGGSPLVLHHNCSGKHSGMLLAAKHLGIPLDSYLDPMNELQKGITNLLASVAGVAPDEILLGTDGCSAPVHALTMKAIARAFAQLVEPSGLESRLASALRQVGEAMREFPEMVAATKGRICTELMRVGKERKITAKAGAEGVYGVGWIESETGKPLGAAFKMEDGGQRGRDPAVIAILKKFRGLSDPIPESLTAMGEGPLQNWRGLNVGISRVRLD